MEKSQRKNSFAVPLIILTAVVLTIAFTLQTVFVTSYMKGEIEKTQRMNFLAIAHSINDLVEWEITANEHILQGYAKSVSYIFAVCEENQGEQEDPKKAPPLNEEEQWAVNNILETISFANPLFETIFVSDAAGEVIYSSDESIIGADITGRDYFQSVAEGFETTYTTPNTLKSKATGNITVVHAVALVSGGKNYGLLGASLNLTKLGDEHILDKRVGETGYPFILDYKGNIIVHPQKEVLFTSSIDIIPAFKDILKSKEKVLTMDYDYEGDRKIGTFIKIDNVGWTVCLAISEWEAYHAASIQRNILIGTSLALIILTGLILSLYIRRNLIGKVKEMENLMFKAAEGDLRNRGIPKGHDEIADMSSYFNTLLDSLSLFFTNLRGSMGDLENVGSDLSANMEETAAAVYQIRKNVENSLNQIELQEESVSSTVTTVEEITHNIQALDKNIENQNNQIHQGSTAVEEMIAQIKTVSGSTEDAEKLMETLRGSARTGRENIHSVSTMVDDIVEKSRKLEEANTLISGIAARTNLLAMNAAIEAAHAGQAGRGFSVVADEIRKLAEQSTTQSAQVRQAITDINDSIGNVVEGSQRSNHSFEEIRENISGMARITEEIKSSMEEQVAGSTQVLRSLEELKDVGREVKSGSEEMTLGNRTILEAVGRLTQISSEVSQAMKEIDNGIDEINKSVSAVSTLSQKNKASIEVVLQEAGRYQTEESLSEDSIPVIPAD